MNLKTKIFRNVYSLFVLMLAILWGQAAHSAEAPWYNGKWAHEEADVAPDATVTFGRLANGFRYAVIPHAFPEGRVSMMLNVQTGSLMERDDELGYAHFVEHMAFNGSKNFKPGELIPFFQQHGMSFGGDTNAHTSLDETVYKLNLSDTSRDSLVMGTRVLRDFADGLLFDEQEVQDELGVILSEKRARDNESLRASRKKREILYAGTRFVNDIIGTDESLNSVSGDKLRAFYDRWYHPDRMMLVVAGNVEVQEVEGIIGQYFADMQGRGDRGVVADWGEGQASGLRVVYQGREHDAVTVSLQTMHKRAYEPPSQKKIYDSLVDSLAQFCMQQRLDFLREQDPDVWVQGIFQNGYRDPVFPSAVLHAVTTQQNWQRSLTALSDELRGALRYGFTEQEMQLALQQFALNMQGAVEARKRMPSEELAMHFIAAANQGAVFTSEEDDLKFFAGFAEKVTLDEVNRAFRAAFTPGSTQGGMADNMTVYVTGPEGFLTEQQILAEYTKAQQRPVLEKTFAASLEFPYLPIPKAATKLPELKEMLLAGSVDGPKRYEATLANGTRLYFVHYPVEKGRIQASVSFGNGSKIHKDSQFAAINMLNSVLGVTGVGRLDSQQSMLLFGYRDMSISESMQFSRSVIEGSGRSEDMELLLQALWTQYNDPVITEKDRMRVVRNIELRQRIKEETVDGASQSKGRTFFYGDALRFADLDSKMANGVSLEDMQAILSSSRQNGSLTVLVSGDFDVNKALQLSLQLFGSEDRNIAPAKANGQSGITAGNAISSAAAPVFPGKGDTVLAVPDPVGKSMLRLVIHSDMDESDRVELVRRQLVADIVGDRLREELREKEGLIYGASVWYSLLADDGKNGFGLFNIALVTAYEHIDKVKSIVNAQLERLTKETVKLEDLERIRKPVLTGWVTSRKGLDKWHDLQQSELTKGNPYIQWDNKYGQLVQAVTPEELQKTAQELFKNGIDASLLIYSTGRDNKQTGAKS